MRHTSCYEVSPRENRTPLYIPIPRPHRGARCKVRKWERKLWFSFTQPIISLTLSHRASIARVSHPSSAFAIYGCARLARARFITIAKAQSARRLQYILYNTQKLQRALDHPSIHAHWYTIHGGEGGGRGGIGTGKQAGRQQEGRQSNQGLDAAPLLLTLTPSLSA